jgi:hypothetical protein
MTAKDPRPGGGASRPRLLALAACALAVRARAAAGTIAVPVEQASVVLVTDKSGSMSATDVAPSRLEAARRAAESFLDEVPDELLVGFVGYATSTESVLEPTRDRVAVRATLGALQADGGTATGDALGAALDRLEARKGRNGRVAPAAIVLLSDGKTTQGGDPLEAAARARQLGVPVYTVALGTPDGVLPNGPMGQSIPVPPDPETLRAIAERSGGQAFEVEDAGELEGDLRAPRIPDRDARGAARDQRRIRRGGAAAPARRRRHGPALARPPALARTGHRVVAPAPRKGTPFRGASACPRSVPARRRAPLEPSRAACGARAPSGRGYGHVTARS